MQESALFRGGRRVIGRARRPQSERISRPEFLPPSAWSSRIGMEESAGVDFFGRRPMYFRYFIREGPAAVAAAAEEDDGGKGRLTLSAETASGE